MTADNKPVTYACLKDSDGLDKDYHRVNVEGFEISTNSKQEAYSAIVKFCDKAIEHLTQLKSLKQIELSELHAQTVTSEELPDPEPEQAR